MTTQLAYLTTTISLNADLAWTDEHSWLPVEQTEQRTLTGALIISSAARVGGRPITLAPDGDNTAWLSLETLTALRNMAVVPGRVLQLTFRGQSYDVIFRHQGGSAIEATPVVRYSDTQGGDWYLVTIRLMEI
jgi:hypothetical protein